MEDITKQEYSAWLEESISTVLKLKPASICICATREDGITFTGYYNATAQDNEVNPYTFCKAIPFEAIIDG